MSRQAKQRLRKRGFLAILPLAALALVPSLPGSLAPLAVVLLGGLWIAGRPSRREVYVSLPLLVIAALLLTLDPVRDRLQQRGTSWVEEAESRYEVLWTDLDAQAKLAAGELAQPPSTPGQVLEAFNVLSSRARQATPSATTLFLLDPAGQVVAWAGPGLLHDLDGQFLPPWGRTFRSSFSAASLLSVRALSERGPNWRVVAGRTFPVDRLPFEDPDEDASRNRRWNLVYAGGPIPASGASLSLPQTPVLLLADPMKSGPSESGQDWARLDDSALARLSWIFLGACLLTVGALRARTPASSLMREESALSRHAQVVLLLLSGVLILGLAGGLDTSQSLLLTGGALFAASAWMLAPPARSYRLSVVMGGTAALLTLLTATWIQAHAVNPIDLAAETLLDPGSTAARLAFAALTFGLFGWLGRGRTVEEHEKRISAIPAAAAFTMAAALLDTPVAAGVILLLAGSLTGMWMRGSSRISHGMYLATAALLAVLCSSISWEIAYWYQLPKWLEGEALTATAPPSDTELREFERILGEHFDDLDLSQFVLIGPEDLDHQDLAYEIWHSTPMARRGFSSALAVFTPDGGVSSFSFGLPMTDEGLVDWSPARWNIDQATQWEQAVVQGQINLPFEGEPWGRINYWWVPKVGFGLESGRLDELVIGLLRGAPSRDQRGYEVLRPALYGLYSEDGTPLISPWKQPPRLPQPLLQPLPGMPGNAIVSTPDGSARAFSAIGGDGVRVLFLPLLGPLAAVERVGAHLLGVAIPLFLAGFVLAISVLPLQVLTATGRNALRSYSTRMALVYSVVALTPLILVNMLTVRLAEERLRDEQLSTGRAALESAQTVLGDYLLSLEPGFGIDVALDDELLSWLSEVVHHEVNLYWQSTVYASSKPELFAAGLLPTRIPGEIYSRLTLLGHQLGSRTNIADGVEYLEIYAPLEVSGVATSRTRLFLSVPLLAQEEEVASAVESLRRNVLLGTALLIVALIALGARLARSFVTPLMEIVEGTQRIAMGDASLELQPRDRELATLVGAIDSMASRIAEGRRSLMGEKRVVERMVDNITSGVVSLDRDGRVRMVNRVAIELLAVQVGDDLRTSLSSNHRLEAVATFVAEAGEKLQRRTIRLSGGDAEARRWSLVWVPVAGSGEPFALLVVEDVSEQMRGQRLEAWAEMARMIAHEIKNPLTPIRLSTQHMVEVYHNDPGQFEEVLESCSSNILRQVAELQEISSEFSTYSRIPRMEAQRGDLAAAVRDVVDAYRISPPPGIEMEFSSHPESIWMRFDPSLLGRAVRNLIENALRAMTSGGTIRVAVTGRSGFAGIEVADEGPGVRQDLLGRIFDPYFSTHASGTGLGLAISRRIAEEHGGRIEARNRTAGGLSVEITIPSGDPSGGTSS